ncbi:unnamed protein product [Dracunculus medinensis]|uniref:Uncharacterized protein n=1 Tax=Dracunculus medinensis TaxID=318479 RepID=A0A0N4UFR5_DRAME|nr:unnamed protein product [Dracunculus medinensis]
MEQIIVEQQFRGRRHTIQGEPLNVNPNLTPKLIQQSSHSSDIVPENANLEKQSSQDSSIPTSPLNILKPVKHRHSIPSNDNHYLNYLSRQSIASSDYLHSNLVGTLSNKRRNRLSRNSLPNDYQTPAEFIESVRRDLNKL